MSSPIGDDYRAWLYARAVAARGRLVCCYCGSSLRRCSLNNRWTRPENIASLDHVLPRARGGQNAPWNLVVCCALCNLRKADRPLDTSRRPAIIAEITAFPDGKTLGRWRRKILIHAHHKAPHTARRHRMLTSPAWASPVAPGAARYGALPRWVTAEEGRGAERQGGARERPLEHRETTPRTLAAPPADGAERRRRRR